MAILGIGQVFVGHPHVLQKGRNFMGDEEEMNGKKPRFGPIPVKEGDTYDVEIEGIGEKGDGIARINNYVIIIPNVQKGDKVKVKINAVRGKVSFGEVIGEASESEPSEEKAATEDDGTGDENPEGSEEEDSPEETDGEDAEDAQEKEKESEDDEQSDEEAKKEE